jgi:hypothetical protein
MFSTLFQESLSQLLAAEPVHETFWRGRRRREQAEWSSALPRGFNSSIIREKRPLVRIHEATFAVVVTSLFFFGCAQTASLNSKPVPSSGPSISELNALIKNVSASKMRNELATQRLVALGNTIVPLLLKELEIKKRHATQSEIEHGARILRVMKRIGTSDALPACRRILLDTELPERISSRHALLTEAITYVCDNFTDDDQKANENARAIYTAFVLRRHDKYLERVYAKQHWEGGRYVKKVQVDVVYGLPLFIKTGDRRAKDVVACLLRHLGAAAYGTMAVDRLLEDGYTIARERVDHKKR